jgi:hypothetical protein
VEFLPDSGHACAPDATVTKVLGLSGAVTQSPWGLLRLPQGQTVKPSGLALGAPGCTCKPEPGALLFRRPVHGRVSVASNSDSAEPACRGSSNSGKTRARERASKI